MTIFSRSRFFFNNFFQKSFQGWVFQNRSYVSKNNTKIFFKVQQKER